MPRRHDRAASSHLYARRTLERARAGHARDGIGRTVLTAHATLSALLPTFSDYKLMPLRAAQAQNHKRGRTLFFLRPFTSSFRPLTFPPCAEIFPASSSMRASSSSSDMLPQLLSRL